MSTIIKNVQGKNIVEFDNGSFDAWCVYLTRQKQPKYAPHDTEYFNFFLQLAGKHGKQKVYNDFVAIYNLTKKSIDEQVLLLITNIANTYGEDAENVDIWFTVIYGGMIAEENKEFAILKKRVKRLGMHQVLLNGIAPYQAANFSKGKKWRELDAIMSPLGF